MIYHFSAKRYGKVATSKKLEEEFRNADMEFGKLLTTHQRLRQLQEYFLRDFLFDFRIPRTKVIVAVWKKFPFFSFSKGERLIRIKNMR